MALTQALRLAPARRDHPDVLLDSLREAARVRVLLVILEVAAPRVDDGLAVRRPLKLADVLSVVIGVIGNGAPPVIGRLGYPDVSRPARVEYPRDRATGRRRDEFRREGRA